MPQCDLMEETDVGVEVTKIEKTGKPPEPKVKLFAEYTEYKSCGSDCLLVLKNVTKKRYFGFGVGFGPFERIQEPYPAESDDRCLKMEEIHSVHIKKDYPEWTKTTKEEAKQKVDKRAQELAEKIQEDQKVVESPFPWIKLAITIAVLGLFALTLYLL